MIRMVLSAILVLATPCAHAQTVDLPPVEDRLAAPPVTVAVIDSGLDWRHPGLGRSNLWRNAGETPDDGLDNDGNGYVDDVFGWNFLGADPRPYDRLGHGTFVAGQIVGRIDRSTQGVAPTARIMPLKVISDFGRFSDSVLAEAIRYAVDNGADIINLSLGGDIDLPRSAAAVTYAAAQDVVVIIAAGNQGMRLNGGLTGHPEAISVGAIGETGRRAPYSNYGWDLDIVAPGTNVVGLRARGSDFLAQMARGDGSLYTSGSAISADNNRLYTASGTSFAAPFVAGAAALIRAHRPGLSAKRVRRMIVQSARDVAAPGADQGTAYGRLDILGALDADPNAYIDARIRSVAVANSEDGPVLQIVGDAGSDALNAAWIDLAPGDGPETWPTRFPAKAGVNEILSQIPAQSLSGETTWTLRLVVKRTDGRVRESRFVVRTQ
ncbi:MAG: S8 family serine peptidase [Pseudomonadota bacterium]